MALPKFPDKDPADSRKYVFNWSNLFPDNDPISTVVYTITPAGLTKVDNGIVDAVNFKTAIHLSGGTNDAVHTITGKATTVGGITLSRSATVKVKTR